MRRLSLTNKKIRNIPRRLKALRKWADSFDGWFPDSLDPSDRYCHWKIPVISGLVEGKTAKHVTQVECAQRLIDACEHLMRAKPDTASHYRVTCSIFLPEMFSSEVCIYMQEDYFQSHMAGINEYGATSKIEGRSLANEWGLLLPPDIKEIGFFLNYSSPDDDWTLIGERWLYGEV